MLKTDIPAIVKKKIKDFYLIFKPEDGLVVKK